MSSFIDVSHSDVVRKSPLRR